MAYSAIPVCSLSRNTAAEPDLTTAFGSDGAYVTAGADDRMLILVVNSGATAADLTLKKGDGVFAAAQDYTVSVTAGATAALAVESGRFVVCSGDDAGRIIMTGATDLSACCLLMP